MVGHPSSNRKRIRVARRPTAKAIDITERPDVGVLPKQDFGLSRFRAPRPLIELVLRRRAEAEANIAPRPEYRIMGIVPARGGAAVHGARARAGGQAGGAAKGFHQRCRHITLGAFLDKVSNDRRVGTSVINDIGTKMGSTQQRKPVVRVRRRIMPRFEVLPRPHGRVSA